MIVGVPREIKAQENRVACVPAGVHRLVESGHEVWVQSGAGEGSMLPDADYANAGARIVATADELWAGAEMIWKVKEPIAAEYPQIRRGQLIFAYLHLAPDPVQTQALIDAGAVAVAFETIRAADGHLPCLQPMSEVAGRLAVQVGARCLERVMGGRGKLLGGVAGVRPAKVTVVGGGTVGVEAARMAAGTGAAVTILDLDLQRLRWIDHTFGGRIRTLFSSPHTLEAAVTEADLVIGAVLVPGARAPKLVTEAHVRAMKPGTAIVDVAIDQGGCVETSQPTTHADPTRIIHDVVHYGVTNMPGAVPRTSTFALHNATLPFALELADKGWEQACADDPTLAGGLNIAGGTIVHPAVRTAFSSIR